MELGKIIRVCEGCGKMLLEGAERIELIAPGVRFYFCLPCAKKEGYA